jgi:hypothetical protein
MTANCETNHNLKSRAKQWFNSDIISCVNCLELLKHLPRPQSVTRQVKIKVQPCTGLDKPLKLQEGEAAIALCRRQAHSAAGRARPMINTNDPIRNRTRDLRSCSAVPQPTSPPHATKCPTSEIPKFHFQF